MLSEYAVRGDGSLGSATSGAGAVVGRILGAEVVVSRILCASEGRRGWRDWRGNERQRGLRVAICGGEEQAKCWQTSSQDGRNISPVILTRSQNFDRLRWSRRGQNAGARTWSRPTIILLNDGFSQVGDLTNVATPHPHVDHSGSLALGNLALRFVLLRNYRRQQAIIVSKKVYEQHWGQGE